jgi:hypothetical protein
VEVVLEAAGLLAAAPAAGFALVVVRLTNSLCAVGEVRSTLLVVPELDTEADVDVALPAADEPLAPPVDPSTVSIEVISCGPGRNTICPSVTVPVSVCPSDACQFSTAVVVASCQVSFNAI